MKFSEYKYTRPDTDKIIKDGKVLLENMKNAKDSKEFLYNISEFNKLRNSIGTAATICSVRHSINTKDEFYDKEKSFFDETLPQVQEIETEFYRNLLDSKFKKDVEEKYGETIIQKAEVSLKIFKPSLINKLQEENKLVSEYVKLLSSAKIEFDGKVNNLSQMTPYIQSKDRNIRKTAYEKKTEFFKENEEKIDQIYDKLVRVRTEIAKELGYENFVQLGYDRLSRVDYGAKEVENYRKQVYNDLVPLVLSYRDSQSKRLGLDKLKYYDLNLNFLSGNPKPKGEELQLVNAATKMYREMSKETGEFFDFMTSKGLLDLTAKEGKAGGGFCTFFPEYKSPFIFSNFNGTSGDVDVLTHEAGHAFQVYSSRNYELPEYIWPTLEACEIHSMSMEFFAWPWMEDFFGDDTEKYKFSHLNSAVLFIPYGVSVDEFQHFVYENPEKTPAERKAKWREIEKKYMPYIDYEENDMLERGTYWFQQGHIFSVPFYYIDYTLAQICALQFWAKSRKDREKAFEDYKTLCNQGGSKNFLELVEIAKLKNPFIDGTIKETLKPVDKYLKSVDDTKF